MTSTPLWRNERCGRSSCLIEGLQTNQLDGTPGEMRVLGRVAEMTLGRGGDLTAWRSRDSSRPNWNLPPL